MKRQGNQVPSGLVIGGVGHGYGGVRSFRLRGGVDRRLILGILVVGGLTSGGLWLRGQTAPKVGGNGKLEQSGRFASGNAPRLLTTAVVVRQESIQEENALSGQVEPYRVAMLAAEYPNRVTTRPVKQGDHVGAGMLLATLDAEMATVALQQAKDALAQTTAARRQAETDYQRSLVETDAGREQARAQVDQAIADEKRARAMAEQAVASRMKTQDLTRAQELRQAEDALSQARTDEHLAQLEANRYTYLVRQGATAQQVLDRAQATLDSAVAHRRSAEQALSLAKEGARQEDRDAATAQVNASTAQVESKAHQIEVARAGLRVADTRDTRLAVIRHQIDGLRAQEAQATDNVHQAEIALAKRTARAPFAGRILATFADVGDLAAVGSPLFRLGQVDRVKVTLSVPEATRPALRLEQAVTVTADALPRRTFFGKITALGFQADSKSRAFPLEVTVENPQEALLPNMVARIRLTVGGRRARLLIPSGAIATDGDKLYVYCLSDGKAVRRNIEIGVPVGNEVEVKRGLSVGDRIAATPQRLTEGANIEVSE